MHTKNPTRALIVVASAAIWLAGSLLYRWAAPHTGFVPGIDIIYPPAGLRTLLVSGGFTYFSERIRQRLGLDFARANTLGVSHGRLTGTLLQRPWGDIVDGAEKKRVVLEVCELMGIPTEQAIAVGDGANDLPMMEAAGLSIAYHPKPAVAAVAKVSILEGGLDRALEVLG